MLNIFKKKEVKIVAPTTGIFKELAELSDPVFSKGMMGQGFAIRPIKGEVVSPINGIVTNIFPTKHAISLKSASGLELLIHVGMDTVELNGQGFDVQVKENQKVKSGDNLMFVNLQVLEERDKPNDVIVVFPEYQGKISFIIKKEKSRESNGLWCN